MKIGIIGAMSEEVVLLSEQLTDSEVWEEAGATFYKGKINEHEVIVTLSGIGKVLAAVTATLLISRYQVDVVINTGSAGGIGQQLKIGDLVISDKVAYSDVDVTAFGYQYGQMAGMPLYYEADTRLIEAASQAARKNEQDLHVGLIVSGDTFVNSAEKIRLIKGHFPQALANEMEGAAIAQVAFRFQVPFVVIRAVSDVADAGASVDFDTFIVEAGKKSANMVMSLLKELA